MTPENLRYTKDHEWILAEGDTATVGITDHAQEELGDIVYVDLPKVGAQIEQHGSLGSVESVKAVSEIYSPASGEVTEVNPALADSPEKLNEDPYGAGWLAKLKLTNAERSGPVDDRRRIPSLRRSREVVALSSQVRIRAPRDVGCLRRELCRRPVYSSAGSRTAEPSAGPGAGDLGIRDRASISATVRPRTPTAMPVSWARECTTITGRSWWIRWCRAASF